MKADKSKKIEIMTELQYCEKMQTLLDDKLVYRKVRENPDVLKKIMNMMLKMQ